MANIALRNSQFETVPTFTAVQTADGWIDGSATGSSTNSASGWWASPRATAIAVRFDPTVAHSGGSSLKVSTTDTTGRARVFSVLANAGTVTGNATNQPFVMRAVPGGKYTLSGWCTTNNVAAAGAFIELVELNAAFAVGTSTGSNTLTGTNGWTFLSVTVTVATTTTYLAVDVQNATAGNISDAWFDDLQLVGPDTDRPGNIGLSVNVGNGMSRSEVAF